MALRKRFIPILMLDQGLLYKSRKYDNFKYVGDPINAVRIFNEKEVDELILLDVTATRRGTPPDFELLRRFSAECFMPLCYGGGVNSIEHVKKIFHSGFEKISFNRAIFEHPEVVSWTSKTYGSQAVVAALDLAKPLIGDYVVYNHVQKKKVKLSVQDWLSRATDLGAGEIFLSFVDRDGTKTGYDIDFIREFCDRTDLPVIVAGGAGSTLDLQKVANETAAQGIAAGSLFVLHGKHDAVLITYPTQLELYGHAPR